MTQQLERVQAQRSGSLVSSGMELAMKRVTYENFQSEIKKFKYIVKQF